MKKLANKDVGDSTGQSLQGEIKKAELLVKQYEIFANKKLHFNGLFWQIPAVFVAICAFIVSIFKDSQGGLKWLFILVVGLGLCLMSYVAHRLRTNIDSYEDKLANLQDVVKKYLGDDFQDSPRSKKYGSRFAVTIFYLALGLFLIVLTIYKLTWK